MIFKTSKVVIVVSTIYFLWYCHKIKTLESHMKILAHTIKEILPDTKIQVTLCSNYINNQHKL